MSKQLTPTVSGIDPISESKVEEGTSSIVFVNTKTNIITSLRL